MDPRHGTAHPFTRVPCGGWGLLSYPLLKVHLRRSPGHRWSGPITALVDTGATITLISRDILDAIPDFDESMLGPELPWRTATHGDASCRAVALDLLLGSVRDGRSLDLDGASLHVTRGPLVQPILLGQRDVLERVGLAHHNIGARPYFRFLR